MSLRNPWRRWIRPAIVRGSRTKPKRPATRLALELLEDRLCPSGSYLIVGSFNNNGVLRYDESTGAFVDQFDPKNLANLNGPNAGVFGSDGNLYVTSGVFLNNNHKVLQYNGTTGAFQTVFATQNITSPRSLLFGPDGNLYVADGSPNTGYASVERFDGTTGAFLNYFVDPTSNGGLQHPGYMVFGPDGTNDGKLDLYVAAVDQGAIYRYDGTTGASKGVFVTAASGGLDAPAGMVFGADGNLYVASGNWFTSDGSYYTRDFPPGAVMSFEGPSDPNPGAFLGTFVAGGSGGLANPNGILFGPNGDLYGASSVISQHGGALIAEPGTSQVLRYDGTTGAFLGTFVTPDSGGLKNAWFLTFTETNPTTLNYGGVSTSAKASVSAAPALKSASTTDLAPLASSLLDTGQQSLPGRSLSGLAAPFASGPSPTVLLPTAGTPAAVPARAADAVFAASHAATNDDAAWLFGLEPPYGIGPANEKMQRA
jgi:sugar lactone lactonase YvrE